MASSGLCAFSISLQGQAVEGLEDPKRAECRRIRETGAVQFGAQQLLRSIAGRRDVGARTEK